MRSLVLACLLVASAGLSARGQEDGAIQTSILGDLPPGVTFEPLPEAAAFDLADISELVQVTRWTEKDGIGFVSSCYDERSGAPLVFLVEAGRFAFTSDVPEPGVEGVPGGGVPTLFRSRDPTPALVVPGTTVDLAAGDIVLTPNGTQCSLMSPPREIGRPVTIVQVRFLPSGPFLLRSDEYTTVEPFDIVRGLTAGNSSLPPAINVGVLTFQPGTKVSLSETVAAAAVWVRVGELDLSVANDAGIIRRNNTGDDPGSGAIPPGADTAIGLGDMFYLPPAEEVVLRNSGQMPLSALTVAIVPALWQPHSVSSSD